MNFRFILFIVFLNIGVITAISQITEEIGGIRFVLVIPEEKIKIEKFWVSETEITWQQIAFWKNGFIGGEIVTSKFNKSQEGIPHLGRSANDFRGIDEAAIAGISPCGAIQFSRIFSITTGRFARIPNISEWKYLISTESPKIENIKLFQQWDWWNVPAMKAPRGPLGIRGIHCNVGEWIMNDAYPLCDAVDAESKVSDWFEGCGPSFPVKDVEPSRISLKANFAASIFDNDDRIAWATRFPDSILGFRLVIPFEPPPKETWNRYWKILPSKELESVWSRSPEQRSPYNFWFRREGTGAQAPKIDNQSSRK